MKISDDSLFYHKKPLFGLDVGTRAVKYVQLERQKSGARMLAWGVSTITDKVMNDGVITNVSLAAKIIERMVSKYGVGQLTTNRVAMSIPVSKVFTRVLTLPSMSKKDLDEAVRTEVQQSVPMPIEKLYWDYEVINTDDSNNTSIQLIVTPREIVDSYEAVCRILGLDLALIQTNIHADAQLCAVYGEVTKGAPSIIVDIGGASMDIGVFDNALRATGTITYGGDSITNAIEQSLGITHTEAHDIKVNEGLSVGNHQKKVKQAIEPILQNMISEIQKMRRFYTERISDETLVSQVLLVGGGANMPGLGDYFVDSLQLPSRVVAPWGGIKLGKLQAPEKVDQPRFLTCLGLALADPDEVVGL
ncbi:MAG: type IV pilus assembly protein PilM [Candidatus Saccharimonadales bacterium]